MRKIYAFLDRADREGLEHPFIILAIRLQFEFAGCISEVTSNDLTVVLPQMPSFRETLRSSSRKPCHVGHKVLR